MWRDQEACQSAPTFEQTTRTIQRLAEEAEQLSATWGSARPRRSRSISGASRRVVSVMGQAARRRALDVFDDRRWVCNASSPGSRRSRAGEGARAPAQERCDEPCSVGGELPTSAKTTRGEPKATTATASTMKTATATPKKNPWGESMAVRRGQRGFRTVSRLACTAGGGSAAFEAEMARFEAMAETTLEQGLTFLRQSRSDLDTYVGVSTPSATAAGGSGAAASHAASAGGATVSASPAIRSPGAGGRREACGPEATSGRVLELGDGEPARGPRPPQGRCRSTRPRPGDPAAKGKEAGTQRRDGASAPPRRSPGFSGFSRTWAASFTR